jgi:hypothetical protein
MKKLVPDPVRLGDRRLAGKLYGYLVSLWRPVPTRVTIEQVPPLEDWDLVPR